MKYAALILFALMLLPSSTEFPAKSQDSDHAQWVSKSLKAIQEIKIGMTRADVERLFAREGGISTRTQRTYVYRECPYIKVDVEFEPDSSVSGSASPKDKITAISKPYLGWPVGD